MSKGKDGSGEVGEGGGRVGNIVKLSGWRARGDQRG